MENFHFVSIFLSIFIVVTYSFISDVVKEFHFTKVPNGSIEYDFEYALSDGKTFRGTTFFLAAPNERLYVMFGADNLIYWLELNGDEYDNVTSFTKHVRLTQLTNDTLYLKSDSSEYRLDISERLLYIGGYRTEWNLHNICFKKSENGDSFDYVITAINNSRKYKNATQSKLNDAHVQLVALNDWPQRDAVYDVEFTDDELHLNGTFCKGISKTISEMGISAAFYEQNINPDLIKALMNV